MTNLFGQNSGQARFPNDFYEIWLFSKGLGSLPVLASART